MATDDSFVCRGGWLRFHISFYLTEEAAAMATDSLVLAEVASLLDRGFCCRRWYLLPPEWMVKFLLSEVVHGGCGSGLG